MNTDKEMNQILEQGEVKSELDYERAIIAERKLRLLVQNDETLKPVRKKLRDLISDWENSHWSAQADITENMIRESDMAEMLAEKERIFIEKRKKLILLKLKFQGLTQQELGIILGHNNKSYMSEIINGIKPLSMRNVIVIHRLLKIELNDLIPGFLSQSERIRIKSTLSKVSNPKIKLRMADFEPIE
jgi:hypothetical protein